MSGAATDFLDVSLPERSVDIGGGAAHIRGQALGTALRREREHDA